MKRRWVAAATVAVGLTIGVAPSMLAQVPQPNVPQQPPVQQMPMRTITVAATGTAKAIPDRAQVQFVVEDFAETAAAATERNNTRTQTLLAALRAQDLGSDHLRTLGFQLNPEYARDRPVDQPEPRIIGYRARNTVQVTVDDVSRVGTILDAAVAAGADRVGGLWFELKDDSQIRARALQDGVARARGEAEAIAGALGEPLGPVLDVSTTGITGSPRRMMSMGYAQDMAFRAEAAAMVPVEPGEIEVTVQVTAVYQIGAP